MGFSSGHAPMFSIDMQQTPENVAKVLDIAGRAFDFDAESA